MTHEKAPKFINKYAARYKTAAERPSCVPDTIPIITKPACPIELYASILFIEVWAKATIFPKAILKIANTVKSNFHCSSNEEKVVSSILIAKAKPAVFEPTDKNATTGVGEPS